MLKKIWNIFTTIVVIAVVFLAVALAGVRIIGLTPYTILSGSMEPVYPTGSIIYVRKCAPADVNVGDAITFVMSDDLTVATHQVCEIDEENEHFYTQGINNLDSEGKIQRDASPVHFNNLLGKPVFCIPYLGYVSNYITTAPGKYVAIATAVVMLIVAFVLPDPKKKKKS